MKHINLKFITLLSFLLIAGVNCTFAGNAVTITAPPTGAMVSSPVKVCMATEGVEVEPAK